MWAASLVPHLALSRSSLPAHCPAARARPCSLLVAPVAVASQVRVESECKSKQRLRRRDHRTCPSPPLRRDAVPHPTKNLPSETRSPPARSPACPPSIQLRQLPLRFPTPALLYSPASVLSTGAPIPMRIASRRVTVVHYARPTGLGSRHFRPEQRRLRRPLLVYSPCGLAIAASPCCVSRGEPSQVKSCLLFLTRYGSVAPVAVSRPSRSVVPVT